MAFETIVKHQIEQFKTPSVKCVDMVVDELSKVVHKCTSKVTRLHEVTWHFLAVTFSVLDYVIIVIISALISASAFS